MKPLQAQSYRAAARKLRRFADQFDARCEPQSPRDLASLTSAVFCLSRYAQELLTRHRRKTGL